LAALLMILWVRFFADRWLPAAAPESERRDGTV